MKKYFLVVLLVLLGYFLAFSFISPREQALVTRVIDGDTLELETGNKVRLLGVNAPEKEEVGYDVAKESLAKAVEGKVVSLERDVDDKDRYGRLLRHVYVNDLSVNLGMVQSGLAHTYFVEPDTRYRDLFEEAEARAIEDEKGIWKKSLVKCISIPEFQWDEGDERNPDDEWVIFRNDCNKSLSLNNWYVKDEATHIYVFEDVELGSGDTVKLMTGSGNDSGNVLYWNQETPVWNNDGDRLFLRDSEGRLVLLEKT